MLSYNLPFLCHFLSYFILNLQDCIIAKCFFQQNMSKKKFCCAEKNCTTEKKLLDPSLNKRDILCLTANLIRNSGIRNKRKKIMQEMGLEPTRSCDHRHLKPARLPIPPLLHFLCFNRSLATA